MKPAHPPRHALLVLALWAITLLAYSNSFGGALVFDSGQAVLKDPRIRELSSANTHLILTQFYWYNTPNGSLYRPLTTFSYLFNYAILGNGPRPAGYHWVNFAIHAVNVSLVFLLALVLLEGAAPAFAVAALWSLHPILTESVANIVGRADLLAAFGVLAGLLCYLRAAASSGSRRCAWLVALTLAAAIGIFSKESGIVVLAVIPLYDLAFRSSAPWRLRVPGYLAAGLPVLVYLTVRAQVLAKLPAVVTPVTDNPLIGADFWTARLTAVKVLGRYLAVLVWPGSLSCDYSYNQIPLFSRHFNAEDWKTILALALLIGIAATGMVCYRRARPVFFFIFFFFVTLAPTANLVILIGAIMAERFLYLPSIGFIGCLVWLVLAARRHVGQPILAAARFGAPAALGLMGIAFCARTLARNTDWQNAQSLWTSAVETSPASFKTHGNLADVLIARQGAASDAVRAQLEQSLAIMETLPPQDQIARVYANLGFCYRIKADALARGGAPGALTQADIWYRKALAVLQRGRAVDLASRHVEPSEHWAPLYLALGRTYMHYDEPAKAVEAFQEAAAVDPAPQLFEEMMAAWRASPGATESPAAICSALENGASRLEKLARSADAAEVRQAATAIPCPAPGAR